MQCFAYSIQPRKDHVTKHFDANIIHRITGPSGTRGGLMGRSSFIEAAEFRNSGMPEFKKGSKGPRLPQGPWGPIPRNLEALVPWGPPGIWGAAPPSFQGVRGAELP